MQVCVLGLGYVGLPTALKLAEAGHRVLGVDINKELLKSLESGGHVMKEPGVTELYNKVVATGRLRFDTQPATADAYVIAVPTPITYDRHADLSAVYAAASSIRPFVTTDTLVIIESTVPPHTTETVARLIRVPKALYAHVPERVLPGNLLSEMVVNDRIVGGIGSRAANAAAELYASFVRGSIRVTDATVAEMAKLIENTYRDVNIALANEFARIGDFLGIDVVEAIKLANEHPRVHMLAPGPGVGGHCVAVDPWFVIEKDSKNTQLIRVARDVNDGQPAYVLGRVQESLGGDLRHRTIALLGLAYKGNVDDCRESPAVDLGNMLAAAGAKVRVHDPYVESVEEWRSEDLADILPDADAIVVMTAHHEFWRIPFSLVQSARVGSIVLDTCGALDVDVWHNAGHSVQRLGDGLPGSVVRVNAKDS